MKVIKYSDAEKGKNSDKCNTLEYPFEDKDIDIGIATITGRYPDNGYGINTKCKELIYVIEGNGKLCFIFKRNETSQKSSLFINC